MTAIKTILWLLFIQIFLTVSALSQNGGAAFVVPVSGTSSSGGSATNAQPPSAVLTNLSNNPFTGYTNKDCYVIANGDTNNIVISGAGLAAANGVYRFGPTVEGAGSFTNDAGTYAIRYSSDYLGYVLTNISGTIKYGTVDLPPFAVWTDEGGGAPAPTGAFLDATNCFVTVNTNIFSTNSFLLAANKVYSKAHYWMQEPFYDEFDRPDTNGLYIGTSTSGRAWTIASIGDASKSVITNGMLASVNAAHDYSGSFYISNRSDVPRNVFNRIGLMARFRPGTVAAGNTHVTLIMSTNGNLTAGRLEAHIQIDSVKITRNDYSVVYLQETWSDTIDTNWTRIPFEMTVISNSVIVQVGARTYTTTITNLPPVMPICMWEIFGAGTTDRGYHAESVWAGFARPEHYALAAGASALLSNNVPALRIISPTLTTNTYLCRSDDRVVAMPASAGSGLARTNKLWIHNNEPGRQVTVYDANGTASGSNIWVMTLDGTTINGSSSPVQINNDYGTVTFLSIPTGWIKIHSYP